MNMPAHDDGGSGENIFNLLAPGVAYGSESESRAATGNQYRRRRDNRRYFVAGPAQNSALAWRENGAFYKRRVNVALILR